MADLTREQIDEWLRIADQCDERGYLHTGVPVDELRTLCTMALRALDTDAAVSTLRAELIRQAEEECAEHEAEIATLRAALQAHGIEAPACYTRTDAERAADAQNHARRITRDEAAWMTFSMRAYHEAQKPRALDTGWRSMESAPRDGTRVLVACVGLYRQGMEAAHWDSELKSWETDDDRTIHPDAWMPLPPPFTGDPATLDDRDPDARRTVAGEDEP